MASAEPISLLTHDLRGCIDMWAVEGLLVADPEHGTAIKQELLNESRSNGRVLTVMWPSGFTGLRLVGGEVAVLDLAGHVVATTGRTYRIEAIHVGASGKALRRRLWAEGLEPGSVFITCGFRTAPVFGWISQDRSR